MSRVGIDCKAYRNSATYATPTWGELVNVREVSTDLSVGEADVSSRGTGGWEAIETTLKRGTIDVEMMAVPGDAEFTALKDAFLNRTTLDMAFLDGPIATAGSQGFRAVMKVVGMSRGEPLEDGVSYTFSLKPAYSANPPTWHVVSA